jgi:L-ascorbate metabolism protein UlaG (beta-lactamase superfamily)
MLLILLTAWSALAVQRPVLEARFIGNMAFAITDGTTTVMTDFPYRSGYSVYMTYPREEIRSPTSATLSLITHRHPDHWDRELFAETPWRVAGPGAVVNGVDASRVVALTAPATFGPVRIEPLQTPHADVGHYSYVLTWHGRRLYFSGDTEDIAHVVALRNLDVAFVSPWLFRAVIRGGRKIDARRIVIYHHQAGEAVPECQSECAIPKQGDTLKIQ